MTTVWVQFPKLPIEYYQDKILFAISKSIGKPFKIDWTTAMATRGKFTRVSIEIDLSKPLQPKFILDDKCYNIEYESFHSFYFLCGRIDHQKEACRFKAPNVPSTTTQLAASNAINITQTTLSNVNLQPAREDEVEFGP